MKKNKALILILSLLILSPCSYLAAQEQEDEGKITYKFATPEEEQNNSFKLTFDKIDPSRFYKKAVLQILNKTTAKSYIVEVPVGESTEVGKLTIKVKKCWQAPLDQKPDSRILLEILEKKSISKNKISDEVVAENSEAVKDDNANENRIFFGWMISSSPSVSSLEHPIYDVTALNCKK